MDHCTGSSLGCGSFCPFWASIATHSGAPRLLERAAVPSSTAGARPGQANKANGTLMGAPPPRKYRVWPVFRLRRPGYVVTNGRSPAVLPCCHAAVLPRCRCPASRRDSNPGTLVVPWMTGCRTACPFTNDRTTARPHDWEVGGALEALELGRPSVPWLPGPFGVALTFRLLPMLSLTLVQNTAPHFGRLGPLFHFLVVDRLDLERCPRPADLRSRPALLDRRFAIPPTPSTALPFPADAVLATSTWVFVSDFDSDSDSNSKSKSKSHPRAPWHSHRPMTSASSGLPSRNPPRVSPRTPSGRPNSNNDPIVTPPSPRASSPPPVPTPTPASLS